MSEKIIKQQEEEISDTVPYVNLSIIRWKRNLHNLFNFNSHSYHKEHSAIQIYKSVFLALSLSNKNSCLLKCANLDLLFDKKQILLEIQKKEYSDDSYCLDPMNFLSNVYANYQDKFLVVRCIYHDDEVLQKGYELSAGDIIRFGKVEYKVKETNLKNSSTIYDDFALKFEKVYKKPTRKYEDPMIDITDISINPTEDTEESCRYCLSNTEWDDEINDLLINICYCKSKDNYVHLGCLIKWIRYKTTLKKRPFVKEYTWKDLKCEICTCLYPRYVRYKKKIYSFIEVKTPNKPYIILERKATDRESGEPINSLLLITPKPKRLIKIGRSMKNDWIINDVTVTRKHAFLKFDGTNFQLFDNDSKFGTLAKIRKNLEITENPFAIQIGRTVVLLKLQYPQEEAEVEMNDTLVLTDIGSIDEDSIESD
jgi:pSer/pThr/pTyr-binding forkhead associated (FHA) protein